MGEEGDLISAELTAAQAELDEYRDTLLRLKAEFDNYKKRVLREQTALIERASAQLIRELLPVLDSFEAALAMPVEGESAAEKLRAGVELVWNQMMAVLENAGLDRIADVDVPFDPQRHEAVMTVDEPREEPDGGSDGDGGESSLTVESLLRSGYALRGRVVRPAMVKVRG
jgi:molecular chaperone GrpE